MLAVLCHPEDGATLWVTISGKCPLIVIDFEHVDVIITYDNSNTGNSNNSS